MRTLRNETSNNCGISFNYILVHVVHHMTHDNKYGEIEMSQECYMITSKDTSVGNEVIYAPTAY